METDLYDLPTRGRDSGAGTFAEGTVTKIDGGYHVQASSERGVRFGAFLDAVYVGFREEPEMGLHDEMDVGGEEFRIGDGELHLREREA